MGVRTPQLADDAPRPGGPLITVTDGLDRACRRTRASHFEDRVTVFPAIGRDDVGGSSP